jgi:hypothetical protein
VWLSFSLEISIQHIIDDRLNMGLDTAEYKNIGEIDTQRLEEESVPH